MPTAIILLRGRRGENELSPRWWANIPSYDVRGEIQFLELIKKAENGEEVIVMRDGEPVVKLVRCTPARRQKLQLGWAAAETRETPGWEKPMTDA